MNLIPGLSALLKGTVTRDLLPAGIEPAAFWLSALNINPFTTPPRNKSEASHETLQSHNVKSENLKIISNNPSHDVHFLSQESMRAGKQLFEPKAFHIVMPSKWIT